MSLFGRLVEIKIQVGKPKTVIKALTHNFFIYHNYEDEIILGPRVLAEGLTE